MTGQLSGYMQKRKKMVDTCLARIIDREPQDQHLSALVGSIRYTLEGNGKRLRPILSIMVYELYKDNIDEILEPACAVELIHSASLMLDDLPCMDNARLRRGKKANHLVYGQATTILASAAMWVTAFKIFSQIESVKINPIIMETADSIGRGGLIRGQFLDIQSFNKSQTIEELKACYYLKTGVLFENAVKIGALMGSASKKEMGILEQIGRSFGLAYQIRDDIHDALLSETQTGKDGKIDQKNAKPTYVSLLGINGAKRQLEEVCLAINTDINKLPRDTSHLLDLVGVLLHT
jgi:geranylgeranyl diphosphate synthase, type II